MLDYDCEKYVIKETKKLKIVSYVFHLDILPESILQLSRFDVCVMACVKYSIFSEKPIFHIFRKC